MSRRKIMLLLVVVMTALGLGCYLPEYFSPVPDLVAELKSCIEPTDNDANGDEAMVDPLQGIEIQLLVVGFNTTRAGTTLLADADNDGRGVTGCVKNNQRLQTALRRLGEERCVSVLSKPTVSTLNGCSASMSCGQSMAVVSAVDGVSIEQKKFGTALQALASLRKDGRINLQLDLTLSELKGLAIGPGGMAANWDFEVVKAKTTVVLQDGQTCFVGGLMRRSRETQSHRMPLVSDLPGIGSCFVIRREVEFDEELLILATPTLVPQR